MMEDAFKPKKRIFMALTSVSALIGAIMVYMVWKVTVPGLAQINWTLPIAFGGLLSAIAQGKTAATGIAMVGKRPEESGKAIIFAVMVETYAVLSLLFSFLLVNGVQV